MMLLKKLASLLITLVMSKDTIASVKCNIVLNLGNYLFFTSASGLDIVIMYSNIIIIHEKA